jgi:RNA polymerase sigma-70 factor (ECF subfamily)
VSSPEDRELVDCAQQGDHRAWEQLYVRAYPRLRAYAVARVGPHAADDVVSETMARAVAGIARYQWQPGGFEPWLFGIARRVTADHHRGAARARRNGQRAEPTVIDCDPGERLELVEEHANVRACFARLPEADREVLELRVIVGLSAEQTAAVLGKRAGAVRTAQSRALARLRRILDDQP